MKGGSILLLEIFFIFLINLVSADFEYSSIQEIIQKNTNGGMNEKEKALSLFDFIINHTNHSYKPYSGGDTMEFFLEHGGKGSSRDITRAFDHIMDEAGFKSRVWILTNHLVTEVYYDKSWHLFDPALKVYYTYEGNIVDLKFLEQNEWIIIEQTPEEYNDIGIETLLNIYKTTEDNIWITNDYRDCYVNKNWRCYLPEKPLQKICKALRISNGCNVGINKIKRLINLFPRLENLVSG